MIYLTNDTTAQTAFIPRTGLGAGGTLKLSLINTTENAGVDDMDVTDLGTSDLFYRLSLELPEGLSEGEYKYILTDDGVEVATGLAMISEAAEAATEYEVETNCTQYNG